MAKKTNGYTYEENGKWYASFTFTDSTGRRRNIKRRAGSKSQAREVLRRLLLELDTHGSKSVQSSNMTFNDLADFYAKHYLRPAEFVNGRKVAGLRDWKHPRPFIQTFRETFGKRNLRSITPEGIRNFLAMRLQTPTMHGRQRSITTVNRELTCLRRLFTIACREGWIHRSPFTDCDTLICVAAERKRERILTREEEERLLTACTGPRKHLRAILLCALDTGMRMGELLKLRWEGVDLDSRLVSTGKSFSVTSNVSAN